MKLRRIVKWVGIGALLFTVSFTASLQIYLKGHRDGVSVEHNVQVANYNDGWTDGQQDLIDRAWNMHYSGKAN